ncbi:MAG: multidrug effflux MFS transporter, partial [Gammaproteobacteria bacterium]
PVMLAGLVLYVAGSVMCAEAPGAGWLIAGRVVQATGGAAGMVLARAMARDLFGANRAASVIATLTMVMVAAPMLAPAIGGFLTDFYGWRASMWLVAASGLAVVALIQWRLPESRDRRLEVEGAMDILRGVGMLARSARYFGFVLVTGLCSMTFFSFVSGAPYVMMNMLGRPATEYGVYFVVVTLGYMSGNFTSSRVGELYSDASMALTGSVVGLGGVLLIVAFVVAGALTPWTLFVPMAIASVGAGIAMPHAQAGAINVFPQRAGTASGFSGFVQMVLAALATQLVGVFQNGTAWPMLSSMLAASLGAIGAAIVVQLRRTRPAADTRLSAEGP